MVGIPFHCSPVSPTLRFDPQCFQVLVLRRFWCPLAGANHSISWPPPCSLRRGCSASDSCAGLAGARCPPTSAFRILIFFLEFELMNAAWRARLTLATTYFAQPVWPRSHRLWPRSVVGIFEGEEREGRGRAEEMGPRLGGQRVGGPEGGVRARRPPGLPHDNRRKQAHLRSRPTKTPPKFHQREEKRHEKTPGERKKNENGRRKKKREILGGPAEGSPAKGGAADRGPAEGGLEEAVRRRAVRRRAVRRMRGPLAKIGLVPPKSAFQPKIGQAMALIGQTKVGGQSWPKLAGHTCVWPMKSAN